MNDVRSHPTSYLDAAALWALNVVVVGSVFVVVGGPLWFVPVVAILIAGGVVKNWRHYRQYAPLPGFYLMVSFLIGYAFISHIARPYDFAAWVVWMIVTYVPLAWVSRRVDRSEPWP